MEHATRSERAALRKSAGQSRAHGWWTFYQPHRNGAKRPFWDMELIKARGTPGEFWLRTPSSTHGHYASRSEEVAHACPCAKIPPQNPEPPCQPYPLLTPLTPWPPLPPALDDWHPLPVGTAPADSSALNARSGGARAPDPTLPTSRQPLQPHRSDRGCPHHPGIPDRF